MIQTVIPLIPQRALSLSLLYRLLHRKLCSWYQTRFKHLQHPRCFLLDLLRVPRPSNSPSEGDCANQNTIIEALVVGKREDHKRPRAEKSQEQPIETMRRQPDRPKPSYPRPPPPLLNSTRTKIFLQIREKGLLRMPNPLKGPRELQDWAKYC
ncbi:hypothetical protein GW17_00056362 [Ensete ventricosum]|nr:hypothetical protein GW17_00056362 [Ensete ventricosum]